MDATHLHLLVNHLPILGTFLALPLLVLALWRRNEPWVLGAAVFLLFLGGAGAVVADESGDIAHEQVEDLAGVNRSQIREHEERAEVAVPMGVVTGLVGLGLLGWALKKRATPPLGVGALLVLSTVSAGVMAWTGQAGGLIRHSELGTNVSASAGAHGDKARAAGGEVAEGAADEDD